MARNSLIIDADDTLWENNVFFDKTITHFVSQLEYLGYTPDYIRHILNENRAAQHPPARVWRAQLSAFA